jgi:predicted AlkP superfamily pyrophosphatase or phosphodiesterase
MTVRAVAIGSVLVAAMAASSLRLSSLSPEQSTPPRLIVLLVIDQMRGDYVDWYGGQWTGGLKRLLTDGATFSNSAFPYAGTLTCPGYFSIGTGTVPALHGMTANSWYDRDQGRSVACASDPDVTSVPFGGGEGRERHSPRNTRVPAFADLLREQARTPPRIVSVGLKPRAAIALGGRGAPDTVVVWEEDPGVWATSTAYTTTPWPDVDEFVRAHPVAADYGQTWTRLLPADRYLHDDDAPGEATPGGWTRAFPHALTSKTGKPDNAFVSAWERSPFSDRFIVGLAMHLLERRALGQSAARTDLLAVSLPALDYVGHQFGPKSHEVQDVLARADAEISRLLDALDRQVGAGRYVIALSADHGVAPIPEQVRGEGVDAGRVSTSALRAAVNQAAGAVLGPGTYTGGIGDANIALTAGTYERLRAEPGAIEKVRAALAAVAGVERVYTADELAAATPTTDDLLRRWRLSYMPGRSGDFVASPKANWVIGGSSGTTHGTPHDYDARVPVVLYGAGIRPGRYAAAAPTDIVPTLAALSGVTLQQTSGRVLKEALVR